MTDTTARAHTQAVDAALDAFFGSGWSTDADNMREAVRAYIDAPEVEALIRRALSDPGSILARADDYGEPVVAWQSRALREAVRP